MEKSHCVLFIGNSYTYFNDMPTAIFAEMGKIQGLDLTVDSITKGGYTLERHADPSDPYGAQVEAALNGERKYDYVILQEQSVRPAGEDSEAFYTAVRNLAARIRKTGAQPLLYATWGRKAGSQKLVEHGWTTESMTYRLAAAYQAIGEELKIPVVHVGLAFYEICTKHPDINLHNADLSHPSYEGSYLAALSLFSTIFDMDPAKIAYRGNLSSDTAAALRKAASIALETNPKIIEVYNIR